MKERNLRSLERSRGKKRFRLMALFCLLIASLGGGAYFIGKQYLLIQEIVFVGNNHVKNEELLSLIRVKKNSPLFGSSGNEIYKRLITSPWVKDAVVRQELSGKVIIKIREAVPVAILDRDGIPYLIDKDGIPLEQVKEGTTLFLPVINGIDPLKDRTSFLAAIELVEAVREKGTTSQGSLEISGERSEDLTLKVDGLPIKIGTGEFGKKLEWLQFVRDEIARRNMTVEYVDLRFANRIILKPVEQTPAKGGRPKEKRTDEGKKKKKR